MEHQDINEKNSSIEDESVDNAGSTSQNPQPEPSSDNLRILEALLFASDEMLTAQKLKSIIPGEPDARQIRKMVDKVNVQLQKERHPFEIVEIGGGYQFRTVAYYHPWVRQIFKEKAAKKLSVQSLECLAIIAYKQPISKAEIEAIRGVISEGAMKTLLEKRLVTITGRSDKPGRPLLYGTTQDFLKYFGLNKIADLPRIEEFEALAKEKMDELSMDQLADEKNHPSGDETETTENTVPSDTSATSEPDETSIEVVVPPVNSTDEEIVLEPQSETEDDAKIDEMGNDDSASSNEENEEEFLEKADDIEEIEEDVENNQSAAASSDLTPEDLDDVEDIEEFEISSDIDMNTIARKAEAEVDDEVEEEDEFDVDMDSNTDEIDIDSIDQSDEIAENDTETKIQTTDSTDDSDEVSFEVDTDKNFEDDSEKKS